MKLKIKVSIDEPIPRHYGYSYSLYDQLVFVCYVFPLNHIMSLLVRLWRRYRHACHVENMYEAAYCRGYNKGYQSTKKINDKDKDRLRIEHYRRGYDWGSKDTMDLLKAGISHTGESKDIVEERIKARLREEGIVL